MFTSIIIDNNLKCNLVATYISNLIRSDETNRYVRIFTFREILRVHCILILTFYFEIYNNEATISGVNIVEVGRYKNLNQINIKKLYST